jgi:hypothetical protein
MRALRRKRRNFPSGLFVRRGRTGYDRVTERNREKMSAVRCQENRPSGNFYIEGESHLLAERGMPLPGGNHGLRAG